jgi:diaminopimelate epimerase
VDGLAASLALHHRTDLAVSGRRFWKMSGSGNDFVFFDARDDGPGNLESADAIGAICERRTGVGADGIVLLERDPEHAFSIRYFNRDGSLAELCGNASLCSVRLAVELGIVREGTDFSFRTTSGPIRGRLMDGRSPEIDSVAVTESTDRVDTTLEEGERRIGFARVGVPHLVVLCDAVGAVDVFGRGRHLRHLPALRDGANTNFVSRSGDSWTMRTYERGVEEETLACGTGAVATASLLRAWSLASGTVELVTASGSRLEVGSRVTSEGLTVPTLRGEGRLVYDGQLRSLPGAT